MNRKTAIALALASTFTLSTHAAYAAYGTVEKTEGQKLELLAQEAPKPESPDQEAPTPKPESPDLIAQEAPKPESPDQEAPTPKPESPDLFA